MRHRCACGELVSLAGHQCATAERVAKLESDVAALAVALHDLGDRAFKRMDNLSAALGRKPWRA